MHLRKRTGPTGTRWQAIVKVGGRTLRKTFKTKAQAESWGVRATEALHSGVPMGVRSVAETIDRYVREVLPTKASKTQEIQGAQLQLWRDLIGHLQLQQVTPSLLVQARDELGTGRAPATVNRYLAILSHVLTKAAGEWQWTERNPCRGVQRLREPEGRLRWLERDEIERLLEACRESSAPLLYPIVILALTTGMRRGEILRLRWPDVDLGRGVIRVEKTKNRTRRSLPLAPESAGALRELVRRVDTELIFPGRSRDGEVQPYDPRAPWEAALEAAEIGNFRFHDLRHTAASYMAMNGASEREIAEMLGHKTMDMVRRYSHLSLEHLRAVQSRMTAASLPTSPPEPRR